MICNAELEFALLIVSQPMAIIRGSMELNINGEVNNKDARGTFYIHVRQIE
jgi:hypothetical protein